MIGDKIKELENLFNENEEKIEIQYQNQFVVDVVGILEEILEGELMKELEEPCKSAIREERCLGCNKLENPDFTGDKECIYCNEKKNSINKS